MTNGSAHVGVALLLRSLGTLGAEGRTDGQLLRDFLVRRDEAAFAVLVRRHGPMVFGVCHRVLGNASDAEDAFQATFLVLARKAAALAGRPVVGDWLFGVARRTALCARRSDARRRAREQTLARPEAQADEPRNDWLPLLDEEVVRLPSRYRQAVVLCDLQGRTRKEAARQLGIPEGTVATRLTRARAMLARRLTRRGVALSGASLATTLEGEAISAVEAPVVATAVRAAACFAAGPAAAGVIPARAAGLTEGVLKAMWFGKFKSTMTVLALMVVAAVPGGRRPFGHPHDRGEGARRAAARAQPGRDGQL
jgi:RNA polymerase sigma factor (sigma-70 family)